MTSKRDRRSSAKVSWHHHCRRCLISCLLALELSIALSACFEPDPRVEQIFPLFIQISDLPSGWYYDKTNDGMGPRSNERAGIISRDVVFRGTRDRNLMEVHVSQELVSFPDKDQAAQAFTTIIAEETPTENWQWPEQFEFESQADQFSLACLDLAPLSAATGQKFRESHWCRAIGQYGPLVSIIYANIFEDKWLTFKDFHRLLTMAEARLMGAEDLDSPRTLLLDGKMRGRSQPEGLCPLSPMALASGFGADPTIRYFTLSSIAIDLPSLTLDLPTREPHIL